jgi:hypothetical protein
MWYAATQQKECWNKAGLYRKASIFFQKGSEGHFALLTNLLTKQVNSQVNSQLTNVTN